MRFFVGLHQPSDAQHFDSAFVSINRLRNRKSDFAVGDWILDSGAFSTILHHGGYPEPPEVYAAQIRRWKTCGNLLAAVTQDYMCEPAMLAITGLTIADHQRLTIERYDELLRCDTGCYIMPVLQGYAPEDYVSHIRQYSERLVFGAWVGVGSICKRNGNPRAILDVLIAIKAVRPDLRLHGFRPEDNGAGEWNHSGATAYCGFDGVEFRGPEGWQERERLPGGRSVPGFSRRGDGISVAFCGGL